MARMLPALLPGLLLMTAVAVSQPNRNRLDNRGRDFYAAFLPTDGFDRFPQFYLMIWSENRTRGTITYNANGQSFEVTIPASRFPVRVDLDISALMLPDPAGTPITSRSIRMKFDDEVTVYGMNTQRWSSDSYLALPVDVLGTTNTVLTYPNTMSTNPLNQRAGRPDFPSQFAVVGTADGTTVQISPSVRIKARPNASPFSIRLNAGEVFLAQSDGDVGEDLSRSTVVSDKPVVVYGSHQRTNIPYTGTEGRDHIVEQLPPSNLWGRRMLITPHFQLPKTVPDANLVRVIARDDSTVVSLDSVVIRTLNRNQFMEFPLDRAGLVTATRPILLAQYQHSSVDDRLIRVENDSIGDPFMTLVPPPEHWDSVYAFECFRSRDFLTHYINIIIPTERVFTLRIDDVPVSTAFTRIGNTSYSYAQIHLPPGNHTAVARAPFGLLIYGFGPYNSYGHPGGMVFDTLFKDQKPPNLTFADTCNGLTGMALDDSLTDFGIETVRLENSSRNVSLNISPFRPGDKSVRFSVQLTDPYQDGRADITAVDTAGLDHRYSVPVKGFTLNLSDPATKLDTLASLNGLKFCTHITVSNYGSFPQTLSDLKAIPGVPGLVISTPLPVTLAPGEVRDIEICYQRTGDTTGQVQLQIGNGCRTRILTVLNLLSGIDSLAPVISVLGDTCTADKIITVSEAGARNAGIKTVDALILDNLTLEQTPQQLPSKSVTITLRRTDPRKDVRYHLRITDIVGNVVDTSQTLPGFTLEAQDQNSRQVGLRVDQPFRYAPLLLGHRMCDTVYLLNYGQFPITIGDNVRLLLNAEFSIPPDQLPVLIQPGQRRGLAVCVIPRGLGDRTDTLAIDFFCGLITEQVQLNVPADPLRGDARDRCQNALQFFVGGFTKRNFLEAPAPNPQTGNAATSVTIGLTRQQRVGLALYDQFGIRVMTFLDNQQMSGGITKLELQLGGLPQGVYHLQMISQDAEPVSRQLIITR